VTDDFLHIECLFLVLNGLAAVVVVVMQSLFFYF
jgi:hypothetical protein